MLNLKSINFGFIELYLWILVFLISNKKIYEVNSILRVSHREIISNDATMLVHQKETKNISKQSKKNKMSKPCLKLSSHVYSNSTIFFHPSWCIIIADAWRHPKPMKKNDKKKHKGKVYACVLKIQGREMTDRQPCGSSLLRRWLRFQTDHPLSWLSGYSIKHLSWNLVFNAI